MNSIWLILLLLCCCNNDGRGNGVCDGNGTHTCIEPRNTDCGCREARNTDCGCERHDNDRDCDYDGRMSPFSPLNRRERIDADYETFRGHHGPCGCEENDD